MIENYNQYKIAKQHYDNFDGPPGSALAIDIAPEYWGYYMESRDKQKDTLRQELVDYQTNHMIPVEYTNGKIIIPKRIDVLDKGFVEYIDHMGDDYRIVQTARTSYNGEMKGEEKDHKLLTYLYDHDHSTPFEFANITFRIHLPIFVRDQWVRHRMASYSFRSFRYTEIDDSEIYYPPTWRSQDTKNKQGSAGEIPDQNYIKHLYHKQIEDSFAVYHELLGNGVAREMARMVLPSSVYTMGMISTDLRNWLHFLTLRTDSHAQWEIQQYALAVEEYLTLLYPWTMELWKAGKENGKN